MAHAFSWAVLRESRMPSFLVRAVMGLYEDNQHWFPLKADASSALAVHSGVKQGCPLSPSLFSLCTAPNMDLLSGSSQTRSCRPCSPTT